MQFLMEIFLITLYFVNNSDDNDLNKKKKASYYIYDERWSSLVLIFNMLAWIVGAQLMAYEYRKRLSESYYCHWLYWSIMLFNNIVFLLLNFDYYVIFLILIKIGMVS